MRRLTLLPLLILVCATLVGCHSSQPESRANYTRTVQRQSLSGSRRDLSLDEVAGGHTLKKHVGRSDNELRERLRHERNISAASTYTDRDTAETAVGAAIEVNRARMERWLEREGGHPNLVLDYNSDHPIGRTLRREMSKPSLVRTRWSCSSGTEAASIMC